MNTTPLMPSTDEEIWRYSRIGELRLDDFAPAVARTETIGVDALRATASLAGIAMETPADVFARLNRDTGEEITLVLPRGKVVEGIVEIVHHVDADGVSVRPRLVIDAGEDSEVTVVERFVSSEGIRSLVVPVLEVRAARSARVNYVGVNELGSATWQIGHQVAVGARDSHVRLNTVALGGDYARVRAEVRLVEQGANAQQLALYFASGSQMHDFRTLQHHVAPRTHSALLFKGAVGGSARSVYTGLIHIAKNDAHSEAFQTTRNLTLGE